MNNPFGVYEELESAADLGMLVSAKSLELLFASCAWTLFNFIGNIDLLKHDFTAEINLAVDEIDFLLIAWLNELIFLHETRHCLLNDFTVNLTSTGLIATVRGELIETGVHEIRIGVKAATYHQLKVWHHQDIWNASLVLDV